MSRNTIVQYELKMFMDQEVWYGIINEYTMLYQQDHISAYELKKDLDKYNEDFSLGTLDVSENVSLELFGIEKISGYIGNGRYIMYQLKKENIGKKRIRYIIDSQARNMVILDVNDSIYTSVEIYENYKSTLVFINMVVLIDNYYINKFDVYKRIYGNCIFYRLIKGILKFQILEKFIKMYPIKIEVLVNEEPKGIYDKIETIKNNGNFIIFSIKDIDGIRIKNRLKYVFGYIWERNYYYKGNIPIEEYNIKYTKIKTNIIMSDFIIGNYDNELYLEEEDRRSYSIIMI